MSKPIRLRANPSGSLHQIAHRGLEVPNKWYPEDGRERRDELQDPGFKTQDSANCELSVFDVRSSGKTLALSHRRGC
jgi:hypothetical protein